MSASARAEARRKAILSRGNDRLAKLTTSARGEDAPAYMKDVGTSSSVSSASRSFLGEETSDMPTPSLSTRSFDSSSASASPLLGGRRSVSGPSNGSETSYSSASTTRKASAPQPNVRDPFEAFTSGAGPDPSVWSAEQQQQFMRALMTGSALNAQASQPAQEKGKAAADPAEPQLPPMDNPLAAMLFNGLTGGGEGGMPDLGALAALGGGGGLGGAQAGGEVKPKQPPSKYQKFAPLLHLVLLWALLSYFVFWFEPKVYSESVVDAFPAVGGIWERWRGLGGAAPGTLPGKVVVQAAPFFWAFMTIEVMLHSVQIFTGSNAVQPPSLLALALPHIPPPFPSIIMNSLKYIKMISFFLDDIAGVIVGLGFIVYFSGFF
ncbi:hypothetical protein NMY22_g10852 [Coprinellus aureogranulatus]|nr:hypothetical protein NMY22_g10852 [Coprinellus aureogranulatus]